MGSAFKLHDDSKGVVTYRHLLSKQTLTPSNPLRCIAHADIDAAYANFERVRLNLSPDIPIACQQWSGLIAINYPARAFGITRHMTVDEAKRKCPELVAVHVQTYKEGEDEAGYWPDAKPETHKVSLEPYRRESLKILKIFGESCPTIEKASIDEAYLDFTQPVRQLIIERNPELAAVPSDSPLGLDTPLPDPPAINWDTLGNLVPVLTPKNKGPAEGEEGQDETAADEAGPPSSSQVEIPSDPVNAWSDYCLSLGAELIGNCRTRVLQQLGYTCSAGVARNKILAKLCSAYRKPNAQTILRNDAIPGFLRPLKFTKIRSLGGKLGASIAQEYDAATVGDLWEVPLHDFQAKFNSENGTWLYNVLRGFEYAEVAAKTDVKSMLSSKNFKPSLTKWDEISYWLRIIATDLYARLNEARSISPGTWPKTIVLGVRDEKYQNRHRQANFPMTSSLTIDHIAKQGEKLLKEYGAEKKGGLGMITNLQLSFAGLGRAEKGQQGIQGFFGQDTISRQSPVPATLAPSEKALGKRKASEEVVDLTLDDEEDGNISSISSNDDLTEIEPTGPVYRCPRCRAVISIKAGNGEYLDAATAKIERVHEDWHSSQESLARKLKEKRLAEGGRPDKTGAQRKKAKKKGQQKLNTFFGKS